MARAMPLHPIERVINQVQNFDNPMAVAFVAQAIRYYYQACQEMPAEQREQMNAGFIGYEAWLGAGECLVEGLNEINM